MAIISTVRSEIISHDSSLNGQDLLHYLNYLISRDMVDCDRTYLFVVVHKGDVPGLGGEGGLRAHRPLDVVNAVGFVVVPGDGGQT